VSTAILLLSLTFTPLLNIHAAANDSFIQINPFLADRDFCDDNKDNDGDGFTDGSCGTKSLKVTYNLSGAISNVSSLCHEGCDDLD
jgi:hypothetical protein